MTIEFMSVTDLSKITFWVKGTIYNRINKGSSMPAYTKVGRKLLFKSEDVENWLEKHTEEKQKNDPITSFLLQMGGEKS